MPAHDWSRVSAGIFHHLHHSWIEEIQRTLNAGLLPNDYYALAEQRTAGYETDMEFYRRKQNAVAVRHVSDDRVVALVEVVSPGNKSSRAALRSFVEKAAELLDQRIHLLILDLHRPGSFDPQGIHGAIWEEIAKPWMAPANRPLTLVGYESALNVKAYVEPLAVGDELIDMPLYLEPDGYVLVPVETTYTRAFEAMPRRWRSVVEGQGQ